MILKPIEIHPEVYVELESSKQWYAKQSPGLGIRFLDEVDRAMNSIGEFPESWPVYTHGTRRFFLHRFPYAVVYLNHETKIQVLALMHLRRRPGYWRNRIV